MNETIGDPLTDALAVVIQIDNSTNKLAYALQIVHQKHRYDSADFAASSGFLFTSSLFPAVDRGGVAGNYALRLRGGNIGRDNDVVSIDRSIDNSTEYVAKLKEAVKEYNIAKR